MRRSLTRHWIAGASLLALGLGGAATAQDTGTRDQGAGGVQQVRSREEGPSNARPGQGSNPRDVQQGDRGQSTQRGDQGSNRGGGPQGAPGGLRLAPEGWVRVGTDYDGDGRFDAVETIYVFDLEQARQSSANRRQGGGRGPMMMGPGMAGTSGGGSSQGRSSIEGTIKQVRPLQMAGMSEEHLLARVETGGGRTAKVDLGPKSKLESLGLKEGSKVSVRGDRGTIDDRPILMARRVESGDKAVDVEMPDDRFLKRVRGKILSTRTVKFRNRDGEHVVAHLRARSGREATAILGPQSRLSELDLTQGDEVAILARPGSLNGRPALVAEQVRSKDRTVEIDRPGGQKRFQSKQPAGGGQAKPGEE